jgi:hypothetical protein
MTKSFRPWKVDEVWLLPPSVQEFVPEAHPAHLVGSVSSRARGRGLDERGQVWIGS